MIATGTDVKPLECVFFMRSVQEPHLLRADEGPRRPRHRRRRLPGGHARRAGEGPLRDRRRRRRHRDRARRHRPARPQADRPARQAPPAASRSAIRDPDVALGDRRAAARLDRRLGDDGARASSRRSPAARPAARSPAASSPRSTPTASSTPRARRTGSDEPTVDEIAAAGRALLDEAVAPLATNPELRERDRRRAPLARAGDRRDLAPTSVHRGRLLEGRRRPRPHDRRVVGAVLSRSNRDEITALQILYARRQPQRLTFREIKELAQAIGRPPHQWTPETLWQAYEQLDRSKVRGSGERVLTDLVSLVRVAAPPGRRARRLPRPRPRALPRLAPPAGERRAGVHRRAARLARADPRPRRRRRSAITRRRLRATRRSSKRAASARRRRCSATTSPRCSTSSTRCWRRERSADDGVRL